MATETAFFLIVFVCHSHKYVLILVHILAHSCSLTLLFVRKEDHTHRKMCVAIAMFEKVMFEMQ